MNVLQVYGGTRFFEMKIGRPGAVVQETRDRRSNCRTIFTSSVDNYFGVGSNFAIVYCFLLD